MDFYLNVLNECERAPDDRPSIGIILCAEEDNLEVEFALKTKANPIGVAVYERQPTLPVEFKGKIPTARQFASALPRLKLPLQRSLCSVFSPPPSLRRSALCIPRSAFSAHVSGHYSPRFCPLARRP